MKKIIFFIFLFFLCTTNALAISCDETEFKEKTLIAENVTITYEHAKDQEFNIIINNLPQNMFIISDKYQNTYDGIGDTLKLNGYYASQTYQFRIFSSTGNCKDIRLATKNLSLPKYNFYSEQGYCEDNSDFKYCDPWYQGYIDEAIFNKAINDRELEKLDKENLTWYQQILNAIKNFVVENVIFISIGSIIVIGAVVFIIIKISQKKRRIKL